MAPRLVLDRRTLRLIATAFVLLTALTVHRLYLADDPHPDDVLVVGGETMGTTWEVRVAGRGLGDSLRDRVREETERRLGDVDRWMSDWNPDSEISRFNAHPDSSPFPVSWETASVVALAIEVGKISGGAFDVTVGPLVALWGFGSDAPTGPGDPPTTEEIRRVRRFVGVRGIHVARGSPGDGGYLRKHHRETRVDLSAIAKGFGVDHVAAGLRALGRDDFLVEIGGEVFAAGARPGGGPWRIGIEKPIETGRAVQEVVELSDQAMATSGDYRIFRAAGDRRISHTIDPRTGRPVVDGPASVTIVAPSATEADAWATALMVLGPDPGLEIARRIGLGAMMLLHDDEASDRGAADPGEGRAREDPGHGVISIRNELFPATPASNGSRGTKGVPRSEEGAH